MIYSRFIWEHTPTVLIFFIQLILIFGLFQMYNLKENLDFIISQIADLDEDIHLFKDLIDNN